MGAVVARATLGAAGHEVLRSSVTGYTVTQVLGSVMNPDHYAAGFHATGTIGAIGAAAAGAHLLGLDVTQTTTALGVAASLRRWVRVSGRASAPAPNRSMPGAPRRPAPTRSIWPSGVSTRPMTSSTAQQSSRASMRPVR